MACKEPAYVQLLADQYVGTKSNGAERTWVVTPKDKWMLGLGLQSIVACLRISNPDANVIMDVRWEYSPDGCTWKQRSVALIDDKSAADDHYGSLMRSAAPSEFLPYARLVIVVNVSAGAVEQGALVSLWGYYQYNC